MSRIPTPRGMLTTRSSGSGPGASKRCLPIASAIPATMANSTIRLMIALPITTKGFRALLDRRVGISTVSGSIAARGLRGVSGLEFFAVVELAPIPFPNRAEIGGYGSPGPGTVLPGSCEFGTGGRAAGRSGTVLGGKPLAAPAGFEPPGEVRADAEGAEAAPAGTAAADVAGRSPPDGGSGLVTTDFLSLHSA